eukprot:29442-Pelagococcus_subviridis.AAC.11
MRNGSSRNVVFGGSGTHPGEVLDLLQVDVVEERVYGQIAAKRVVRRGPEGHLRDPALFAVILRAQVHEVEPHVVDAHRRRLQVFALVRVGLYDPDAVHGLALLSQMRVHELRELAPEKRVDRDVDVRAVLSQEFISHPPARDAQRHGEIVLLHHLEERREDALLLRGARHRRPGGHRDHRPLRDFFLFREVARVRHGDLRDRLLRRRGALLEKRRGRDRARRRALVRARADSDRFCDDERKGREEARG